MSTQGHENRGGAEMGMIAGSEENSIRFSPELVDERRKSERSTSTCTIIVCTLTEVMDRLIQNTSAKESTMTSSRGFGRQYELPYSEGPGSSKFPKLAPLTTTGYSLDNHY